MSAAVLLLPLLAAAGEGACLRLPAATVPKPRPLPPHPILNAFSAAVPPLPLPRPPSQSPPPSSPRSRSPPSPPPAPQCFLQQFRASAKTRVDDLEDMLSGLQSASKDARSTDASVLEAQLNQMLGKCRAEPSIPSTASSLQGNNAKARVDDLDDMLSGLHDI